MRTLIQLMGLVVVLLMSVGVRAQDSDMVSFTRIPEGNSFASKLGLSYWSLTSVEKPTLLEGGASAFVYQYLSLNYRINQTERFTMRSAYLMDTAGYNKYGESIPLTIKPHDFHVTYSNFKMAELPNDMELSGTFYLHFPTSESSQDKRWAFRLASWMRLEKKLDHRWSLTYNMKPKFWALTQNSYRTSRTASRPDGSTYEDVRANVNQLAEYEHYLELSRYYNSWLTPKAEVGMIHEWYADSDMASGRTSVAESLRFSVGSWININRQLRFIASLQNTINLRDRYKPFGLFREDETEVVVMTFLTLL